MEIMNFAKNVNVFGILKTEFTSFVSFLKENRYFIIVASVFLFIAYGFLLTNFTLSIDEELELLRGVSNNSKVLFSHGRFGAVFLKNIMNDWQSNSITFTFLGLLTFLFSTFYWAKFLNDTAGKKTNRIAVFSFVIVSITFPGLSEVFGFSILSLSFGVIWGVVAVSVFLTSKWVEDQKNIGALIFSVLMLILAISVYQAWILVYLQGLLLYFFLKGFTGLEKMNLKEYLRLIVIFAFVILVSIIGYFLINKINFFFNPSSRYVDGFLPSGKEISRYEVLKNVFIDSVNLVRGKKFYGTFFLLPTYIVSLVIIFYIFFRYLKKSFFLISPLLIMLVIPFLFSVVLGKSVPLRVQYVFALFLGGIWFIFFSLIEKRSFQIIALICIVSVSYFQSIAVSRLLYSDYTRYQRDVRLAEDIGNRIQNLGYGSSPKFPVVVIGDYNFNNDLHIIKNEVLGYSIFEWAHGCRRKYAFLKFLGYDFQEPTVSQIKCAYEVASIIPKWPAKGCVKMIDNLIVCNLGAVNRNKVDVFLESELFIKKEKILKVEEVVSEINLNLDKLIFHDMNVKLNNNFLEMMAGNSDPRIFNFLSDNISLDDYDYFSIELESDVSGRMQVFLREFGGGFSQIDSGWVELEKGYNKVYVRKYLDIVKLADFRIDPPNNSNIKLLSIRILKDVGK